MSKYAVVVLADTQTDEGVGRVYNALMAVKQLSEAGNQVGLYFDGTGTRWIGTLEDSKHPIHGLYASVSDHLVASCSACADFFGVKNTLKPIGGAGENEVDYAQIISAGNQVLTF